MISKYFPDFYFKRVEDISIKFLLENNIKGIIFDMDNTLIDFSCKLSNDVKKFVHSLKRANISVIIVSNAGKRRVSRMAKILNVGYIYNACKPGQKSFKKAHRYLKLPKEKIAIIGDQIFTDILGGKKYGIKTILIKPISVIEIPIGLLRRPFEIPIIIAFKKANNLQ